MENLENLIINEYKKGLTCREKEILQLVSKGLCSKEIGPKLSISKRTVDKHISNACLKLGARGRSEAVAITIKRSLI